MTEADIIDVAVEVQTSHQYSIMFYCHVIDGSSGAIWHNGV